MKALYSLYDALVAISVPTDKARAVVEAMEEDMATHLATKSDLISLRNELKQDISALQLATRSDLISLRDELKQDISALQRATRSDLLSLRNELKQDMAVLSLQMTVRLGSMLFVAMGLLFAALKLI